LIISAKNLCHIYSPGTPFETAALKNISFSAARGDFIGIIGHTGSGKSTLVQHLNGLLKPTSGQIFLKGTDIWQNPSKIRKVRFDVGLVFQYPEHQLFEETVFKDIAFGPRNMGLSEAEIRTRVLEAMEFSGLDEELCEKSPFELSGGQKRRVAIAGVIAMQPDVLILDEPTAGLDPRGRMNIMRRIKNYHDKKKSCVIFVSHSMEEVARDANKIVVMNKGEILLQGTPSEVFQRSEEIRAAGLDVPQITKVFDELKRRGVCDNPGIYTIEQAKSHIMSLLHGTGGN